MPASVEAPGATTLSPAPTTERMPASASQYDVRPAADTADSRRATSSALFQAIGVNAASPSAVVSHVGVNVLSCHESTRARRDCGLAYRVV